MRFLLALSAMLLGLMGYAQAPIVYTLDLSNIQHHELGVQIEFPALGPEPLVVRMPTSSPGRYAEHNFAKNVYDTQAFDSEGNALPVQRTGLNEWTVAPHDGQVRFEYTLYANRADGTYAKVDNRKLHLNMPATFAYAVGFDQRPIELHLPTDQQASWQVATQLESLGDRRFRAPNYSYFYDSPTFVGTIRFRRWTVPGNDRVDTIEMAFMTPDPDSLLDAYADWTKKVVEEQRLVYGELPAFDFGRYTFLCAYNPYVSGDGMEHRNSTICSASVPLEGYSQRLIGTISHEFFHCWNVERIRPASLEPFNFDEANVCGELWFAEGFTSYFDDLSLVRAGIIGPQDYASGISGMLNYVLLRPGSRHRGPVGMSQCAPFVDAASSIDPDNFDNTFISYYSYGAVLGMALDLELRRDHNTDLNAFMQAVWQQYGSPEIPYHIPDLERVLAELTNNPAFAKTWFAQHIYDSKMPDLPQLLGDFGIKTEVLNPDSVGFYGLRLRDTDNGLSVSGTVFENNPLYEAGLEQKDIILKLNGQAVTNKSDWDEIVRSLSIGENYAIRFRQNGIETEGHFTAEYDPSFRVSYAEQATKKVAKRRVDWLKE